MFPTVLILLGLAALVFYLIYCLVNLSQSKDDSLVKKITQDEFLWGEGYAFATLKVDIANFRDRTPIREQTIEDFQGLNEFVAVVRTRDRGAYLSRRVEEVSRTDREIVVTITFERALGPIIIEDFIVLHDYQILSSGFDPAHQHPIPLEKGDTFRITQTIKLEE